MKNRIVYHVTHQYMKQNRRRTMTAFYGIVFMVLLMTCVFVGKDTAISYLEQVGSARDGKWHVSMYDVTNKELEEVNRLDYVQETAVSGNLGQTDFAWSANAQRPYLNVKAYAEQCFDWMNIKLTEGKLPQSPDEILLSESVREDGAAVQIGDTIAAEFFDRSITGINEGVTTTFPFYEITLDYGETLEVPENFPYYGENDSFQENKNYKDIRKEYTVVGFMESPGYETGDSAGYTALTRVSPDMTADGKQFNISMMLDLTQLPGDYIEELRDIGGSHTMDFNEYVLVFSGSSSDSTVNLLVNGMVIFFLTVIIVVSVILIYNLFNMSFEERSRYLGMLCSVGATGRQKRSSVYFEAFYLLIFALPVGLLLGLGVVWIGMMMFQPFIENIVGIYEEYQRVPVTIRIFGSKILFIILGSLMTVFVSAYLPARKISKTGPIECIRGNERTGKKQHSLNPGVIRRSGAEGMLAHSSLRVQRKKTRGIVRSAAAFMVILIVTAFGTQSITRLVSYRMLDSDTIRWNTKDWDYMFGTVNGNPESYKELKEEIKADKGVDSVCEWYEGMAVGNIPFEVFGQEYWDALHNVFNMHTHRELSDEEFAEYFSGGSGVIGVLAVDNEIFEKIAAKTDTDAEILNHADAPAIVVQDGEISTENWRISGLNPERYQFYQVRHMTDLDKGEEIPMELYSAAEDKKMEFPLTIAGYATNEQLKDFISFHTEQMWVIVKLDTGDAINEILADPQNPDGNYSVMAKELFIKMNGTQTQLVQKLQEIAGADMLKYVFIKADYTETLADSINAIIRILLYCFVLLSSVICLLNLYNSVRGRTLARRREFAVMKSVGATGKQMRKMLNYECAGILLRSILWTVVIATLLVYLIRMMMIRIFGYVRIAFPWYLYLAAAAIAGAALVILTQRCFTQADRGNLLENIREENQ